MGFIQHVLVIILRQIKRKPRYIFPFPSYFYTVSISKNITLGSGTCLEQYRFKKNYIKCLEHTNTNVKFVESNSKTTTTQPSPWIYISMANPTDVASLLCAPGKANKLHGHSGKIELRHPWHYHLQEPSQALFYQTQMEQVCFPLPHHKRSCNWLMWSSFEYIFFYLSSSIQAFPS